MTRGTIAIIADDGRLLKSTEFNGDMYLDGYGEDAVKCLENVDTEDDFEDAVRSFDLDHHHYNEEQMVWEVDSSSHLDMSKGYYDTWFSDYVYLKNVSTDSVTIIDSEMKTITLKPDEIAVFNFGEYLKPPYYEESLETLLAQLLREHVGHSVEIVEYGDGANFSLEDVDTGEVIFDTDTYDLVGLRR